MHHLIASYLFQNKTCPLPGLGTISIQTSCAEADFTIQQIAAPQPVIQFNEKETSADDLLNYLARKTNSNNYEVTEALDHFCDDLKNQISIHAKANLDMVGNLVMNDTGHIIFEQSALPEYFLQPVFAERVIHPKTEHTILVGDKETTNTVMTELLSGKPGEKDLWWVWAIVIGVIGLLLVLVYFTELNGTYPFGNALKI